MSLMWQYLIMKNNTLTIISACPPHWLIVVYDGAYDGLKKRGKTKQQVGAFGALRPLVVERRMGCHSKDLDIPFCTK